MAVGVQIPSLRNPHPLIKEESISPNVRRFHIGYIYFGGGCLLLGGRHSVWSAAHHGTVDEGNLAALEL